MILTVRSLEAEIHNHSGVEGRSCFEEEVLHTFVVAAVDLHSRPDAIAHPSRLGQGMP